MSSLSAFGVTAVVEVILTVVVILVAYAVKLHQAEADKDCLCAAVNNVASSN